MKHCAPQPALNYASMSIAIGPRSTGSEVTTKYMLPTPAGEAKEEDVPTASPYLCKVQIEVLAIHGAESRPALTVRPPTFLIAPKERKQLPSPEQANPCMTAR